MLHINISPLGKHIDELRNLLFVLSHPFDIIGVTDTRLHETDPLSDIDISGDTPLQLHNAVGQEFMLKHVIILMSKKIFQNRFQMFQNPFLLS